VLPRHGAKLACSFPKSLLLEKAPLPRWQCLHPDAGAVSHLFRLGDWPALAESLVESLKDATHVDDSGFREMVAE
jgi:hypothetical protein